MYYGHFGTIDKCPDYQGVLISQVSLYDEAPFGGISKCVDYAGVLIFLYTQLYVKFICSYTVSCFMSLIVAACMNLCAVATMKPQAMVWRTAGRIH